MSSRKAFLESDPTQDLWRARADAFLEGIRPILDWARDVAGPKPSESELLAIVSWSGVCSLVENRSLLLDRNDCSRLLSLSERPELVVPLRRYLADTAGYDPALPAEQQRSAVPETHHGYVLFTLRDALREYLA